MRDFLNNKSVKLLVTTLAIVLIFSIMGAMGTPWVSSVFSLATGGLSKVSAAVTEKATSKSYKELQAENEELKKEIADLRAQLVDYYDLQDENARLWQYYGIKKENEDYELVPANVMRRDANSDFYSFTLDVGTTDGVNVEDVVITQNGLVGYVSKVDAYSCKVTTILSPDAQVGAFDKNTGDSGIVTGNAKYCDKNQTKLTNIDSTSLTAVGDVITTSGLGGVYPNGLIIGEVKDIKYDDYDATKYAVIEPYEDIRAVTDVAVITNFDTKGKIITDSTEASE